MLSVKPGKRGIMRYYKINYSLGSAICNRIVAIPLQDIYSDNLGPQLAVNLFLKRVSFSRFAHIISVKLVYYAV